MKPTESERWGELDDVLLEFVEDLTEVSPPPEFEPSDRPTVRVPRDVIERLRKGAL